MNPRLGLFWVLTGAAVLILLTSIPLILRMVPRNRWYGVRTRHTMNGTEAEWYAANRAGGFMLLAVSTVALLVLAGVELF